MNLEDTFALSEIGDKFEAFDESTYIKSLMHPEGGVGRVKDLKKSLYYMDISDCSTDFKNAHHKLIMVIDDLIEYSETFLKAGNLKKIRMMISMKQDISNHNKNMITVFKEMSKIANR